MRALRSAASRTFADLLVPAVGLDVAFAAAGPVVVGRDPGAAFVIPALTITSFHLPPE